MEPVDLGADTPDRISVAAGDPGPKGGMAKIGIPGRQLMPALKLQRWNPDGVRSIQRGRQIQKQALCAPILYWINID
jgi:hypothetical protein